MCRTSSDCDSNKESCKMLKITRLETVKVRSWSTLSQFSRVFRSEISSTFGSPLCSSARWKKIIFTVGNFHHRITFSFQNSRISCHEWCIFCPKGNHLRKQIKKILMALILNACFWNNMEGGKCTFRVNWVFTFAHTHTKGETQL